VALIPSDKSQQNASTSACVRLCQARVLVAPSIFTLCHVHANNFSHVKVLADCFPMPETLELTYIGTDLVSRASSKTIYPTELDKPNFHQFPELMLWYFPFVPGSDAIRFTAAM
jgi:hypothetical protein